MPKATIYYQERTQYKILIHVHYVRGVERVQHHQVPHVQHYQELHSLHTSCPLTPDTTSPSTPLQGVKEQSVQNHQDLHTPTLVSYNR